MLYTITNSIYSKARPLFESEEEFLECFDDIGCDKTPILLELDRFEEAGDIALSSGNNVDAIQLFLKSRDETAIEKACSCLVEEWWKSLPLAAERNEKAAPHFEKLCRLSSQIKEPPKKWTKEVSGSLLTNYALTKPCSFLCSPQSPGTTGKLFMSSCHSS
jgi:hypothetical protein